MTQAAGRLQRGSTGGRPAVCGRGSTGGRSPGFDKERYAKRNTVERAINKLKQFRAVATRYDKRAYVCLGTVTAAALLIWLRSRSPGQPLGLQQATGRTGARGPEESDSRSSKRFT